MSGAGLAAAAAILVLAGAAGGAALLAQVHLAPQVAVMLQSVLSLETAYRLVPAVGWLILGLVELVLVAGLLPRPLAEAAGASPHAATARSANGVMVVDVGAVNFVMLVVWLCGTGVLGIMVAPIALIGFVTSTPLLAVLSAIRLYVIASLR